MTFKEAYRLMKSGCLVRRRGWGGYWYWDAHKNTIILNCKDGRVLDIRETEDVDFTLSNILADDWEAVNRRDTFG